MFSLSYLSTIMMNGVSAFAGYDTVVGVGASLTDGVFELTPQFETPFRGVTFVSASVPGTTLQNILDNIETFKALATGRTLFVCHMGGNDCTNYLSAGGIVDDPGGTVLGWSDMTTEQHTLVASLYNQIIDELGAVGDVALASLTFRDYKGIVTSSPDPDAIGAGSWNTGVLNGLIQTRTPNWWDDTTGKPILDFYSVSRSNPAVLSADNVHQYADVTYTAIGGGYSDGPGSYSLREYMTSALGDNGVMPSTPFDNSIYHNRILINIGTQAGVEGRPALQRYAENVFFADASPSPIIGLSSYDDSRLAASVDLSFNFSHQPPGRVNLGTAGQPWSEGVDDTNIASGGVYTTGSRTQIYTISNVGRGNVSFIGLYSTTAITETRSSIMRVTDDNGTTDVPFDNTMVNGTDLLEDMVATIPYDSTIGGTVTMELLVGGSTDAAYISGIGFDIETEVVDTLGIWLVTGQSLSVGTLNPSFNTKPAQPQIPSNFKMFNLVGSVGLQNTGIVAGDITSMVPYEEQGTGGTSEYYTLGTTFLSDSTTESTLWMPAGIGGATITQIGNGGTMASYANQVLMLARAKALQYASTVKGIIFIHGGANWSDTKTEYYDKMVTFLADQITAVQVDYPNETPPMYIYQHGGERVVHSVQRAQLQMAKDNRAICVGSTYWLNRQHPNTTNGVNGSPSDERVHLNVLGYQYLGDMFKRAASIGTGFKPMYVESYAWENTRQLKLTVHNPEAGTNIVIDTSQANMPSFAGRGIEIEQPNGILEAATTISVSGNVITVDFPSDVRVGDRLHIGFTPEDIKYDGDFVPNAAPGSYPAALIGTNIRGSRALSASLGNPDYYDWLAVDTIEVVNGATTPVATRGNNCWRAGAAHGAVGWGSSRTFAGGLMTVITDSVSVNYTITRDMETAGASSGLDTWNIKAGSTYELTAEMAITSDIAYFQVFIGGGGGNLQQSDIVGGLVSLQITATEDFGIRIALRERSGQTITDFEGHMRNIEIREVLA